MYALLARICWEHPWRVVVAWLVTILVVAGASGALGASFGESFSIPGTESQRGADLLEEHFGGVGAGPRGTIVFRAEQGVDNPDVRSALAQLFIEVDELDGVNVASPYDPGQEALIARQTPHTGLIAYAEISLAPGTSISEGQEVGDEISDLIEERGLNDIAGLQVEVGGIALAPVEAPESEAVGLAVAVLVLIVVLGSVVAMVATVGAATITVLIGVSAIVVLSNGFTVPEVAPIIGLMVGLGVGIDYGLFILTRYREALDGGLAAERALAVALDSAGRSVIFAGVTVVISLLGMMLIGVSTVAGLGLAAALTVAVVMIGSVTLLPALVSLLGDRIFSIRIRGVLAAVPASIALLGIGTGVGTLVLAGGTVAVAALVAGSFGGAKNPLRRMLRPRQIKSTNQTGWYRLSRVVQARPWSFAAGGTALLLILSAPILDLHLGAADEGNFAEESTTRQAYDLLADGFGPGANGPLLVVSEVSAPDQAVAMDQLAQSLSRADGVAASGMPIQSPSGGAALIHVQPATSPQDEATSDLVRQLRDVVIPQAVGGSGIEPQVTGPTAATIDLSSFLRGRTVAFFAAVLGASFILLMIVFRSLVVPLKAVIMNMLSIGAAYGVAVAVFQWGWVGGIVGVSPGPIEPFIPMALFAILFGLSMDYEVFLLSRMREEYKRTGDPVGSVADGMAATARVITAAAVIMVVIFGSFVLEDARAVKMFGLGLATAVAVDATIVRMLIVPSTMELLGARNWWLPGWLDRILPDVNIEGSSEEASNPV